MSWVGIVSSFSFSFFALSTLLDFLPILSLRCELLGEKENGWRKGQTRSCAGKDAAKLLPLNPSDTRPWLSLLGFCFAVRENQKRNTEAMSRLSHVPFDVHGFLFAFLEPRDQASLRRTSRRFRVMFDHAAQRGYVPVMVCEEYVEDVNELHQDGEDGNPKFHFAPGEQKNFFAPKGVDRDYKMQRSEKDTNATLIVNVAKMLGKGETKLKDDFLRRAQFKAVHFIGTEFLQEIGEYCLAGARNLVRFTMSTPCPKFKSVGNHWLARCLALSKVDFTGCTALERVGYYWLYNCTALKVVTFDGCSALETVAGYWLADCSALEAADFTALVALKSVGRHWLSGCSSLKTPNLAGCPALEEVGDGWMYECESLEEVRIEACVSLEQVGRGWLKECPSLRRVILPAEHLLSDDDVQKVKKFLE